MKLQLIGGWTRRHQSTHDFVIAPGLRAPKEGKRGSFGKTASSQAAAVSCCLAESAAGSFSSRCPRVHAPPPNQPETVRRPGLEPRDGDER
ncbi:hypothetical protein HPB50_010698 [Hyalomma asiaticum]|uniref:Uncharacterized protein n=1 Tax=Hyalomma asiaticum TaxID=266040 RepID=A0ACB7SIG1_HYAAI|nr:hypothetical protein HPB50_010698 [Hyalomma asiaticum]